MRIVFMGTPSFSATILQYLVDQHEVVGVFTRPDAIRSRGKKLVPSPVKQVALDAGIDVYTPKTLRDPETLMLLQRLAPEAICVAAYGAILTPEVLAIPPHGCLNVHASLLPAWRGAAPIERAILAGDEYTGVSIMRMEEGLDTGDYAVVRQTQIDSKNTTELTEELADLGAAALLATLGQIEQGSVEWTKQDDFFASYAEKVAKHEFYLDPEDSVREACLKVRASSAPHPAKCFIANRGVTVLELDRVTSRLLRADLGLAQGEVTVYDRRLYMGFSDGVAEVVGIRPDGKRSMAGIDFAAGLQAGQELLVWSKIDG